MLFIIMHYYDYYSSKALRVCMCAGGTEDGGKLPTNSQRPAIRIPQNPAGRRHDFLPPRLALLAECLEAKRMAGLRRRRRGGVPSCRLPPPRPRH